MNIALYDAERLQSIAEDMVDLLDEFKRICRKSMPRHEYQQFKYRTLGHIEPALSEETDWITQYSSIDSLQKVAEKAIEEANQEKEVETD